MAKFIKAQVINKNSTEYDEAVEELIPCTVVTLTSQWRVPVVNTSLVELVRFDYKMDQEKPTPDSNKVIKLFDPLSRTDYTILVEDDAALNDFSNLCNGCCADIVDMPTVTLRQPILEEEGCNLEDGDYHYFSAVPPLSGDQYYFGYASKNGVSLEEMPEEGFASQSALLTWVNTHWGAAGTWTLEDNRLTLTSDDAVTGYVNINAVGTPDPPGPPGPTDGENDGEYFMYTPPSE